MLKKCAVINDLSGFGKCSLTASIPVLSVMGVEAHPLPTAVLSNQTAYDSYEALPLTDCMKPFYLEWKKLGVHFDSILTGFVMNSEQLDIISGFINEFKENNTILVVDPVMADNGRLYNGYTPEMCEKIRALSMKADVITPNISELFFLAERDCSSSLPDIISCGLGLLNKGYKSIVATGYTDGESISNIVFTNNDYEIIKAKKCGGYFSGTGDLVSAVITGGITRGQSLSESTKLATAFVEKAVMNTAALSSNDGVDFESVLGELI